MRGETLSSFPRPMSRVAKSASDDAASAERTNPGKPNTHDGLLVLNESCSGYVVMRYPRYKGATVRQELKKS